jgi:hypothetical protein
MYLVLIVAVALGGTSHLRCRQIYITVHMQQCAFMHITNSTAVPGADGKRKITENWRKIPLSGACELQSILHRLLLMGLQLQILCSWKPRLSKQYLVFS